MIVEGTILRGPSFDPVEGRVVTEEGEIAAIEETAVDSDSIVLPAFVNAHTHIGDSVAKEAGADLSVEELVAPPDGLKHQLLRTASRERMVEAMRRTMRYMEATGTGTFLDFREGGLEGVETIDEASQGMEIEPVVLGREDVEVLQACDGFGASGAADGEFGRERRAAADADKLFGIHAGEVGPGDINPALDLEPDFVVHMVAADTVHMERMADSDTPVVVCPRANAALDVGFPPVEDLLAHTDVALGTDNVMLSGPSMFREMAFLEAHTDLPAETILGMATRAGAKIARTSGGVLEAGNPAKLLVLDGGSDNLAGAQDAVRAVVRRAGSSDVEFVLL